MPSLRTEKAIKLAIAAKLGVTGNVIEKTNGNHVIEFVNAQGEQVARFTLRQIISKRYPRKKK